MQNKSKTKAKVKVKKKVNKSKSKVKVKKSKSKIKLNFVIGRALPLPSCHAGLVRCHGGRPFCDVDRRLESRRLRRLDQTKKVVD